MACMNETDSAQLSQFSLRQLIAWLTAAAVLCGLAMAWASYLRYVEATNDSLPLETIHLTALLALFFLTALLGLIIGPPLCLVLANCQKRRREPSRR
jgi:hypothetical protein